MFDRYVLTLSTVTTVLGVFAQLEAIPYRLRLSVVGVAAFVTSAQAIGALTRHRRSSAPAPPHPSRPDAIMRALAIGVAALITPAALVFVDRYHSVRVHHIGQAAGASEVRIASPLAAAALQVESSVGQGAFLVAAPVPAGHAQSQPRLTIGPTTPSSAQFFIDQFDSPQRLVIQLLVDPAQTAVTVEVTTSTAGITVLYDDDIARHTDIALTMGGLLCVGGWLLLWWRWPAGTH